MGHSVTETSPPPHHRGIRNFRVVACVLVAQESSLHLLRLLQFAQREWSPLFFFICDIYRTTPCSSRPCVIDAPPPPLPPLPQSIPFSSKSPWPIVPHHSYLSRVRP